MKKFIISHGLRNQWNVGVMTYFYHILKINNYTKGVVVKGENTEEFLQKKHEYIGLTYSMSLLYLVLKNN